MKFSISPITVSPITVKGTPDRDEHTKTEDDRVQQHLDTDLSLYYKVYNRFKPEFGESNAESVARTAAFEAEYQYRLLKTKTKSIESKQERNWTKKLHSLSPSTPPKQTVTFKRVTLPKTSTIKPIIRDDKGTRYLNNVQDIPIDTDYYLHQTPSRSSCS